MLHGRAAEQERVDALVTAAATGRSGALVVRGEAGVGKTALLEYAASAAAGVRVLRGTGVESEAELPFAALHLLLRPGLPRLDVLPAPQARALRGALGLAESSGEDRFLVGLAALSLLAELAGDGALVCVVDDAHWLDRPSADALLFAARRLDAEGVVLLFGARDEDFDAPGIDALTLGRIDRASSRALLAERAPRLPPELVDRVLAEADGNPLALVELAAAVVAARSPADVAAPGALSTPLPVRLQDAYYRQVADLPAATRTYLLLAAAADSADLDLLSRASRTLGVPASAVEAAERAGLVRVRQEGLVFRHPLVRSAVYQGATSVERTAAHRALAAALPGDLVADRRAWHRAAAATGPDESVAMDLERAAERARQRLGHAAAGAAWERAARLTPTPPDKARRLIAAGTAALAAGRTDAAAALAGEARTLTAEPADLAEIARVQAWVALDRGAMHTVHELVIHGAEAVAGSDPTAASALLMLASIAASWTGDATLIQTAAARMAALDVPPHGTDRSGSAPGPDVLRAMADLLSGRPADGVPRLRDLVASARRDGSAPPELRFFVANLAMLIGDFDGARALMLSAVQACRTHGVIRFLAPLSLGLSYADFGRSRFRAAAEAATDGLRLAQDTGQPLRAAGLNAMLALLAAVEGDEPRCREMVARALGAYPVDEVASIVTMSEWALALLDLGLGRYDAALRRFELTASGSLRDYIQPVMFAPDQIEAAVRLGVPERAAEPLARFAAWARAVDQPPVSAVLQRCLALVRPGDAEGRFRQAMDQPDAAARPFPYARTALLYGEWLRRNRRGAEARPALRTALDLFDRLGARPWADRARAELRAAGEAVTRQAPVPDRLSLLSPQELQVVRLAASGATNRDIAAHLLISPRTVSHHLYRAFPKLGVTNRTALARLDLTGPDELP